MAHILLITTGLTGMLHASFEVVARLEAAGHRVTYASPGHVRDRVAAQGFTYRQLPEVAFSPAPKLPKLPGLGGQLRRQWIKLTTFRRRRQEAVKALRMEDFTNFICESSPDLLLLDLELADHIITAHTLKIPLALLNQFFSGWKRPGLPPLTSAIIPGKSWRGHWLYIEWAWWRLRTKRWLDIIQQRLATVYTDRRSILLHYAKHIGFPTNLLELYNWPPPFTFRRLPVLSMTAGELEFPHRPRSALHYVGPMVYTERKDPLTDPTVIARLENIFAQKQLKGQRLIHCSVSTMNEGDSAFLQRLIKGFGERPEWILVVGLGGLLQVDLLGSLPDNVYLFDWLPQLQVLQQADCSIHHGGIHTINECIHFRVPMLVYSGKKYDQDGNAARIAYHGFGIRSDKDKDDIRTIQKKIDRVLKEESFKRKMEQVHATYQSEKNKTQLVKIIEQLIKHGI